MASEENDWIFDFILGFLNSGRFDAAVMDFVDEKCAVFDNEEENKLIYTEIHQEFKDHVDVIISSNLEDLGVTPEIFYQACVDGRNSRNVNKTVYDKIIAMDDFLTFKKIMVKRNTELELETIRAYRRIAPGDMNVFGADDEEEFEAALRESAEFSRDRTADEEDEDRSPGKRQDDEDEEPDPDAVTTEEEMQYILRNSLLDMELLHKQEEMEQLELEQAIAVSLALEEERLRQMQMDSNLLHEVEMEAELMYAGQLNDSGVYEGHDEDEEEESTTSGAKGGDSAGRPQSKGEDAPAAQRKGDQEDDEPIAKGDKHDDDPKPRKKKTKKPTAKPMLDVPEPKPLKMKEFRPLPGISKQFEELQEKKKQTMDVFQKNQELLAEQRATGQKLREQVGADKDEYEAMKRAKYMREQRDKLIAMKKKEREAKVREEEERKGKQAAEKPRPADMDFLEMQSQAKSDSKEGEDSIAERKRAAMRNALARRMKQELIEASEAQQAKAQEDQFSELDRQLRQVEMNRRENHHREMALAEQVRRQHDAMAKNVQRSAASMKQN
eukprot:CAMPEP_0182428836 /NCGR_PEP_ID=MMETSP1167-20130531/23985_1 /TAXON_ID=2988 /ORGANISM="Mallomonas Sp, Strain CCMP3275" /LENGTH=553 /DNA_ID=CAMNT_0024611981 /DNA_START=86 /DNA_END=1747 /DNA_ORIENTATION=-